MGKYQCRYGKNIYSVNNGGSSQKDILENTDAIMHLMLLQNKDKQNTKNNRFSVFSSEDVSAYIVFKEV